MTKAEPWSQVQTKPVDQVRILSDCCLEVPLASPPGRSREPPGWGSRLLEAVTRWSLTPRTHTLPHHQAEGRSIRFGILQAFRALHSSPPSSSMNSAQPIHPLVDSFRSECALGLYLCCLKIVSLQTSVGAIRCFTYAGWGRRRPPTRMCRRCPPSLRMRPGCSSSPATCPRCPPSAGQDLGVPPHRQRVQGVRPLHRGGQGVPPHRRRVTH